MADVKGLTAAFSKSLTLKNDNAEVLKQVDEKSLNDVQVAELHQWLTLSSRFPDEITTLNDTLRSRTFLLDQTTEPSVVDAIVLGRVAGFAKGWSKDDVVANRHVVRWLDLIQNALELPESEKVKVDLDLEAPREVKSKPEKKKDGAAAPAAAAVPAVASAAKDTEEKKDNKDVPKDGVKKEKKKKEKKPQPAKVEIPITPGLIDLRVGWIEKAVKHPDADSLYVSTIHMGDEEGPRTVCSGLVKYIPLEDMQNRKVIVVANLKPVSMRGIKSCAMVLCASNEETVEFVNPPEGSEAGDKIYFETYDTEPEKQLNPKKKVWETVQPGFTTNSDLEVVFKKEGEPDRKLVNKKNEVCKAKSIADAQVR